MSGKPLRFVHSGDWHLEQPLHGIGEVPEHLRELFLDAPFKAAEHVLDTVVQEHADFLILSGDVLSPRAAGPRGLDFLRRQLNRLCDERITVYWARGPADRFEQWPAAVPLPANVHRLSEVHVESITHRRDKQPEARILGCGSSADAEVPVSEFAGDASLPSVAVAHGVVDADRLLESDIDYWALGGRHSAATIDESSGKASYCGSPQGRRPEESGSHGCAVVEMDSQGRVSRETVSTDVVRWENIPLELPDELDRSGLLRILRDRTHQLLETAGERQLLVRWMITDSDELTDTRSDLVAARLREGGLADELLDSLRREFGMTIPGVWHVEISVEPSSVLPSGWYEEDTVLGDLLRAVQHLERKSGESLPLDRFPQDAQITPELETSLKIASPEERQMILRCVAALGVDLLRGDRVLSDEFALPSHHSGNVGR